MTKRCVRGPYSFPSRRANHLVLSHGGFVFPKVSYMTPNPKLYSSLSSTTQVLDRSSIKSLVQEENCWILSFLSWLNSDCSLSLFFKVSKYLTCSLCSIQSLYFSHWFPSIHDFVSDISSSLSFHFPRVMPSALPWVDSIELYFANNTTLPRDQLPNSQTLFLCSPV